MLRVKFQSVGESKMEHVAFFMIMFGLIILWFIIPIIGMMGYSVPADIVTAGFSCIAGGIVVGIIEFIRKVA